MEKKTDDDQYNFGGWLFAIILGIFLWIKLNTQKLKKEPYITTRKALSKLYEIDLKTFNKWVQIFADPTILNYDSFSKQRGISQKQNDYLLELFGSPTEDRPKYSKAQIIALNDELEHEEYRSVRKSLRKFANNFNITPEIYAQLNFFPPRIGRELKQQMGC